MKSDERRLEEVLRELGTNCRTDQVQQIAEALKLLHNINVHRRNLGRDLAREFGCRVDSDEYESSID